VRFDARPARSSDLADILRNPSAQTKADLAAAKLDAKSAYTTLRPWLKGATAHYVEMFPVCIFGVINGNTWFVATQPYFDSGVAGLRYTKRWLKETYKDQTLTCISRIPSAAKWFRVLGFERVSEDDGAITYVYKG
jgi:hypothetical protein